jgi:hypothetical protein
MVPVHTTHLNSHVRFGSKADMCAAKCHVRFTPNSDHKSGHPMVDQRGQPTQGTVERCAAIQASWRQLAGGSTAGFARMVERAGIEAKFGFKAHPYMPRPKATSCCCPRPIADRQNQAASLAP